MAVVPEFRPLLVCAFVGITFDGCAANSVLLSPSHVQVRPLRGSQCSRRVSASKPVRIAEGGDSVATTCAQTRRARALEPAVVLEAV